MHAPGGGRQEGPAQELAALGLLPVLLCKRCLPSQCEGQDPTVGQSMMLLFCLVSTGSIDRESEDGQEGASGGHRAPFSHELSDVGCLAWHDCGLSSFAAHL